MKNRIGIWLMFVAGLHMVVSIAAFHAIFFNLIHSGFFNSVGKDATNGMAVWCFLFGVALFVCGLAIHEMEKQCSGDVAKSIGWSIFFLAFLGVMLMPASGFWLAFPSAIAILVKKTKSGI